MANRHWYPRILGLLTLGYGTFTALRPESLVHAAELEPRDAAVSTSGLALGRLVGTRDVLSGLSMILARPSAPLQAAVAARVCCDLCDMVGFGLAVPPPARAKVIAIAGGWGVLCATSWLAA